MLEIRAYTPADREHMLQLQRLLWNDDAAKNGAYLDWKYHDNPYLAHRHIALAWRGSQLVGMLGAFGASWDVAGRAPIVIPCLADAVLLPELRGTDLFRRMVDALLGWLRQEQLPWLVDFGNGEAAVALMLHGWASIGPWSVGTAARQRPITDDTWWSAQPIARGRRTGEAIVASRTVDANAVAAMAARARRSPTTLRHVRDAGYFAWWFANPLARYFFLCSCGGQPRGTLVAHHGLDRYDAPSPTTILDCEAESDALWLDLVELAVQRLPGTNVRLWLRDLPAERRDRIADVGLTARHPSGRLTRDHDLPNMLLTTTGAPPSIDLDVRLAESWDLRGICGRSWR